MVPYSEILSLFAKDTIQAFKSIGTGYNRH